MSEQQPHSGAPEYLEYAGGRRREDDPVPSPPDATARGSRRRTPWIVAIAAVLLIGGGAAAWAVMSFFRQGAQPAEALPASTIAYVSVDLDPSGGQKIDAFKTLDKFPAFRDQVGVNSVDDVRRKLGEAFLSSGHCDGMTYAHDIEPWLGDRAALAAVDLGGKDPSPVVVLQVKDEGRARTALGRLSRCAASGSGAEGFEVANGWAVLSNSQDVVDKTVAATADGSLADDATYRQWIGRLGDSGVVTMYAAPQAGTYLAGKIGQWASVVAGGGDAVAGTSGASSGYSSLDPNGELTKELRGFTGAAATIRFTGNGLELASVSQSDLPGAAGFTGNQAGVGVTRLPDDTAAAFGLSLKPGWAQTLLDRMSGAFGGGTSRTQLYREIQQSTGLRVPADLETLLGSSTTFAVGGDIDYADLTNATDGSHVPVGAVVRGDPSKVESVLDTLRSRDAGLGQVLGSDSSGDRVAIGPSADYRQQLLAGGHLGDTAAFQAVVPAPDQASEILYADMDRFERSVAEGTGSDQQTVANVKPLQSIGFSVWLDGDLGRMSLRISTH